MSRHIELEGHEVIHFETRRHLPPHERKKLIHFEFDDRDCRVFQEVFGEEDTAKAAMGIIQDAPPEIQILTIQVLKMIEEVLPYEC